LLTGNLSWGATADDLFQRGLAAYQRADYAAAAEAFQQAVAHGPATGTLLNLGNAEWQRGAAGPAILAWERAVWLDPFNASARQNIRLARKTTQLEAPALIWYEVVSSWLPLNWWAWIAGISLWVAVGVAIIPGILRQRRAAWHQAVAAFALMFFLLSIPAHFGVYSRAGVGFTLPNATPLHLTPTSEGQVVTRLPSGEPIRKVRVRGDYVLVTTGGQGARGWIQKDQCGWICQ
jgi:tetratricopeptide (TPR) repeat protein